MKTIVMTVVCLLGICTTVISQKKTASNYNPVRETKLFPVKEVDITNPANVTFFYSNKEKNQGKPGAEIQPRLTQSFFIVMPVNYYTKEKKYNLIN